MGSNPLLIIGLMVAVGVALNFARMWLFVSTVGGNARAKASRIADLDAHLTFDERIAERMRELEKEQGSGAALATHAPASDTAAPSTPFASPAPAATPQGFGRRGI